MKPGNPLRALGSVAIRLFDVLNFGHLLKNKLPCLQTFHNRLSTLLNTLKLLLKKGKVLNPTAAMPTDED